MKAIYTVPLFLTLIFVVYLFTPTDHEYHAGTRLISAYVESSKAQAEEPVVEVVEDVKEIPTEGFIAGSYADDPLLLHFFVKHLDNKKMNMTSDFAPRNGGTYAYHYGIDIQGNSRGSQKVDALSPGPTKVISTSTLGGNSGNVVILEDLRSKLVYRFMHLHKIYVKNGQILEPGEAIARMGDTGTKRAWHVHFEINMTPETDPSVREKIKAGGKWIKHAGNNNYDAADPQSKAFKYHIGSKPPAGIGRALLAKSNEYNWTNVAEKVNE